MNVFVEGGNGSHFMYEMKWDIIYIYIYIYIFIILKQNKTTRNEKYNVKIILINNKCIRTDLQIT